jgi:SAM-dependent methyltransferase
VDSGLPRSVLSVAASDAETLETGVRVSTLEMSADEHAPDGLSHDDIPYGDDWQSAANVAVWIDTADRRRPWRVQIRERIAEHVVALQQDARVLELGSGPGLLAECILERCPNVSAYTLLDFSPHMLGVSRERLARFPAAKFVLASFKSENWVERVEAPFDCVVSMQAVHELRHKRHAARLYRQADEVTAQGGRLLICDHVPLDDTAQSQALYMTEDEQFAALSSAGFTRIRTVLAVSTLRLYACEKS